MAIGPHRLNSPGYGFSRPLRLWRLVSAECENMDKAITKVKDLTPTTKQGKILAKVVGLRRERDYVEIRRGTKTRRSDGRGRGRNRAPDPLERPDRPGVEGRDAPDRQRLRDPRARTHPTERRKVRHDDEVGTGDRGRQHGPRRQRGRIRARAPVPQWRIRRRATRRQRRGPAVRVRDLRRQPERRRWRRTRPGPEGPRSAPILNRFSLSLILAIRPGLFHLFSGGAKALRVARQRSRDRGSWRRLTVAAGAVGLRSAPAPDRPAPADAPEAGRCRTRGRSPP